MPRKPKAKPTPEVTTTEVTDGSKPHLVLFWTFDIPNYRLYIDIDEDLTYEALEGGTMGYYKIYKGEKTYINQLDWQHKEKFWISEHYGEKYGYFQPDASRWKKHPVWGWDQLCVNGLGPDGEYIDHMQRMQIILEGHDMSEVFNATANGGAMFVSPDCGKTIYKRAPTRDVNYNKEEMDKGGHWPEWPQACLMQPRTKGVRLSNYDELAEAGAPTDVINLCKAGKWPAPKHPELQKWYVYPTADSYPDYDTPPLTYDLIMPSLT